MSEQAHKGALFDLQGEIGKGRLRRHDVVVFVTDQVIIKNVCCFNQFHLLVFSIFLDQLENGVDAVM